MKFHYFFHLAGQIKRERKDPSSVTGLGFSILIASTIFVLSCSKFGLISTGTIPMIHYGNTNGRNMALVQLSTPNLHQRNSISSRGFNGLVVQKFGIIQI